MVGGSRVAWRGLAAAFVGLCVLMVWSASASAKLAPAAGWELTAQSDPTNLPPGGSGQIEIDAYNTGAASSTAGATLTDTLPAGLTAVSQGEWVCTGASPVTCTIGVPAIAAGARDEVPLLDVGVEAGASGRGVNGVTVQGGGAAVPASFSGPVVFSSTPARFGIERMDGWLTNADGTPDTQAGSHPYEATFSLDFTNVLDQYGEATEQGLNGGVRNVEVALPPGFVGDPNATPQCTRKQFDFSVETGCPASTQVGIDWVTLGNFAFRFPVYNLVPPAGIPAQFGLDILGIQTFLDASVRSGGDYGITTRILNIPQREIRASVVTLWGVPSEPSHNAQRCSVVEIEGEEYNECGLSSSAVRLPFLTLPTACEGPLTTTVRASGWLEPDDVSEASFESHDQSGAPLGVTGCEHLTFGPAINVAPDTSYADTPAGLTVQLRVPQEALLAPEGISTADIKNTKVVLPEGVVINPGQAAGLAACQSSEDGVGTEAQASCPNASKVGTDEIETPLLAQPLRGSVYVLQSNPPELKLLVTASGQGVNLKLVGDVHLNEATGQLTTTFDETPEVPFTSFKLSFSGGAQAALDTPTSCGVYSTSADFTPWATPLLADLLESSSFQITAGVDGAVCPSGSLPFSPELVAGSTTDQAGGFTDFSLLLRRGDGQQRIEGLRFKAPDGLTGELAKVPLCTNAQAESNTCPEASRIGHTVVESGPGPYPLLVPEPGQEPAPIYLTEAYDGAPFGLSIVVPLHVGPFVLPTQRVRAKIEVDPSTSALTVTTNPLPQVVAGVPTDLREVDAVIERPEFMVNPTNCDPQEFTGTAYGTPPPGQGGPGASAAISSHFQVGACRALEFSPKLSVATSGKTSRTDGASLTAKVAYPAAPQGSQADIGLVKVELPKQLPSRLKTLQKACTAAQFEASPAGCPAASVIGHAVVHTPLLPVPLTGPAIFVSHGGEAFPSLTVVLQGDGVTVDLVGTTFISKAGITSTTFKTVPDDPFSTFELTLPEGPYSALAADGRLCGKSLALPTEFIGQNGAVIHQSTKIAVTGCPKTAHHQRKKRHHQSRRRGS
jgi:hypothetical protein